jgi:hypothetical protein
MAVNSIFSNKTVYSNILLTYIFVMNISFHFEKYKPVAVYVIPFFHWVPYMVWYASL